MTMSRDSVLRNIFYGKSYWVNENLRKNFIYTMYEVKNKNNLQLAT